MDEKHFSDFYKVPDIVFDIKKLRVELDRVLKHKKFKTLGITNFAAIPINKIPGDANSIKGHNVRGTYWTFPDESGKEVMRDKPIDESKYTEILPEFKNTYFEEVYNLLRKKIENDFKISVILFETPRNFVKYPAE